MSRPVPQRKDEPTGQRRLVLLASKLGYQTRSFVQAARRLGVDVLLGTDRCYRLEDPWGDAAIPLRFDQPEEAAETICRTAPGPLHAVLALGDHQVLTAAHVAARAGLSGNSIAAAENCRTKLRQRQVLQTAGLPVPRFVACRLDEPAATVLAHLPLPCVVKPLALSASQGVIRADTPAELEAAIERVSALLRAFELRVHGEAEVFDTLLVEEYVPGQEVALEGVLTAGELRVLALFDKPDPLEGPYFEETLYVTPSRLPADVQEKVLACARSAVRALGLEHGPLHAEFRLDGRAVWILEIQPRPIGGLCARALRFGPERISLEELLIRHALGLEGADWEREPEAAGVMMIPVPRSGIFCGVEGLEDARQVAGITDIEITARLYDPIRAWPEGSSYLGFIFARAADPAAVERALRQAHARLRFRFASELPVTHPAAPPDSATSSGSAAA